MSAAHCPTCTCSAEPEHACEWCAISLNHPLCPENADEVPCPHCHHPEDVTLHAEGCPTLDTCAQTWPDLPRPWHPEAAWYRGTDDWLGDFDRHMAEAHPTQRRRTVSEADGAQNPVPGQERDVSGQSGESEGGQQAT